MRPVTFHVHTAFCDGADTPEALAERALELGCEAIGFSGHSPTAFDLSYCMTDDAAYRAAVRAVKERYKDRLRVYLGVEQDFYAGTSTDEYDYIIGSVHYLLKNGKYLPVDDGRQIQIDAVSDGYGGDWYAFAEDYFRTVARVYEKTGCDIIGHFDLLTKYNGGGALFDEGHPRYLAARDAALEKLLKAPAAFEINYRPVVTGGRKDPYPAPDVIDALLKAGKPLVYSSDCHDKKDLLFGFDDCVRRCGGSLISPETLIK